MNGDAQSNYQSAGDLRISCCVNNNIIRNCVTCVITFFRNDETVCAFRVPPVITLQYNVLCNMSAYILLVMLTLPTD